MPGQIDKAIELKTFLLAIRIHARVRILPTDYRSGDLLETHWQRVAKSAVPSSPCTKNVSNEVQP